MGGLLKHLRIMTKINPKNWTCIPKKQETIALGES
jgi:hypothetical protein